MHILTDRLVQWIFGVLLAPELEVESLFRVFMASVTTYELPSKYISSVFTFVKSNPRTIFFLILLRIPSLWFKSFGERIIF